MINGNGLLPYMTGGMARPAQNVGQPGGMARPAMPGMGGMAPPYMGAGSLPQQGGTAEPYMGAGLPQMPMQQPGPRPGYWPNMGQPGGMAAPAPMQNMPPRGAYGLNGLGMARPRPMMWPGPLYR